MKSIWNSNIKELKFNQLQGDIKTDVLIIGGGMCGIICAYMLKNAGVDCVLAEADKICAGISNSTTAKITFQHGLIYDKITNKYGTEKAYLYYDSQREALEKIKSIASEIDDFQICNSYVYSLKDRGVIEREVEALNKIGCSAEFCEKTELPFGVKGAVKVSDQAKLHPLKFAYAIAKDLKIYENTKILELKKQTAITTNGRIFAKKVIVATHFPFINKHGGYFLKMYQHRSYVIALKNAENIKDMYVDEAKDGLSFRSHKDLLLLGGGSHRTGSVGGGWEELRKVKEKYYPYSREEKFWATQDCMTLDSIPYIGRYSKATQDLYVATGFNKWGMTSSMVSAMILTDMICGRKNKYEDVYSPSRTVFHTQLAVNAFESAKNLLTPTTPRCPHMGCALKYNKEEHSWDCPCHGSRFEENGNIINNPATDDMKK
ncbi:MAG: FAD-dependent oxidoreductase [Ruminococcaceae bacterium]|nr:FAD-dependent oxidoreductase [Oscillospiraceae bacterium]